MSAASVHTNIIYSIMYDISIIIHFINMYNVNVLHYKYITFIIHRMLAIFDILVNSSGNLPLPFYHYHYFGYVGTFYLAFLETLFVTASSYFIINSQTRDWFSSLLPAPALSQQAYTSSYPLIIPILIIRSLQKQPNILHSAKLI